ncbi:hypothetical protein [Rhizobium sp. BR 314]|uniref:hypothetical protein n=1 Tax=Rhizobium sp. BR 314 TaxID=3040013 RepID=UPI0039BF5762
MENRAFDDALQLINKHYVDKRMLVHPTNHASTICCRVCHVAAVANTFPSARPISSNVVHPYNHTVVFNNKRAASDFAPLAPLRIRRHSSSEPADDHKADLCATPTFAKGFSRN